ncbi:MAG: tetratricopeptide repeat protein [Anaeromyxobacter sp.]
MSPAPPSADPSAQAALDEGLAAFQARDLDAAHAAFARAHRRDTRDVRMMSWYGVTLVLVEKNSNLGVQLCDQALRLGGVQPDLLLNLARVHLALNQRDRAVKAVSRGLDLWPDEPRLQAALAALGTRSEPVLPFLARGNPLNRALGRWRHRWRHRHAPAYELSPVALGMIDQPAAPEAAGPAAPPPAAPEDR